MAPSFVALPSPEKIKEHLEPVLFTLGTCFVLYLASECCPRRLLRFFEQVEYRLTDLVGFHVEKLRDIFTTAIDPHLQRYTILYQNLLASRSMDGSSVSNLDSELLSEEPTILLTECEQPAASQDASPLLALPAEIVDLIISYALTDQEDLENPYPFDTCYRRPNHFGPRFTYTAILRTCQYIYRNYWYLPWTRSSHVFYLANDGRRPRKTVSDANIIRASRLIQELHPDLTPRLTEVANVQIFAQLCWLESGSAINEILRMPYFRPRSITITLRHTDWWSWEDDHALTILNTTFVRVCRYTDSIQCVTLELESIERRKTQVDWMANYMARNWHFTRTDDVHLVASPDIGTMETERWKGCATWEGQRWVRDEDDKEPNVLSYYILKVPFRAVDEKDDPEGYAYRRSRQIVSYVKCDEEVVAKCRIRTSRPWLSVNELKEFGIKDNVPAGDAVRIVNARDRPRYNHGDADYNEEWDEDGDEDNDEDDNDDEDDADAGADEDEDPYNDQQSVTSTEEDVHGTLIDLAT